MPKQRKYLGTRTLLGAPGLTTRSILATRSKGHQTAVASSWDTGCESRDSAMERLQCILRQETLKRTGTKRCIVEDTIDFFISGSRPARPRPGHCQPRGHPRPRGQPASSRGQPASPGGQPATQPARPADHLTNSRPYVWGRG